MKKHTRQQRFSRLKMGSHKSKDGRTACIFVTSVVLLSILILGFLFLSPKPFIYVFLQKGDVSRIPDMYSSPEGFEELTQKSVKHADQIYNSAHENSTYDLYLPRDMQCPPVLVFVHGGGFLRGDKEMAAYYGPSLAAEGYAVISINYLLVPDGTLDDQTKQVVDLFNDLPNIVRQYNLDIDNIFVAGTSAGGYLAARVTTAFYNAEYANQLGLVFSREMDIQGLILFSAPYEISAIQNIHAGGLLKNLALYEVGWAITGDRTWRSNSDLSAQYNLYDYIVKDMPSIFVSDGNHNSFTDQAKRYVHAAKEAGVHVIALFFDGPTEVGHGYQMNMRTKEAQIAFKEMINFITEHTQSSSTTDFRAQ